MIVAVGRLSIEKGFQHLIRVFAALAKTQAGCKLLVIGDGPMLPTLQALCTEIALPINDFSVHATSVIFAGYQKNALPLMALGRVYAMTSATEGFPNVVLEAIAAGLPVAAANTPWGARAILSDDIDLRPYPTDTPTDTPYGRLMPRIDLIEHEQAWAQTLHHYLQDEKRVYPRANERLQRFNIAAVGAQWNQLLSEMQRP